jgi:two-component SAPR family response regulator
VLQPDSMEFKNIMIVDDEVMLFLFFKSMLEKHGYTTNGFAGPQEALNEFKMNDEKYALVISDIKMPRMNGFELVSQIKQIYSNINILLITAFEFKESEFAVAFSVHKD